MKNQIKTFSYDARVVMLDGWTAGCTLRFRHNVTDLSELYPRRFTLGFILLIWKILCEDKKKWTKQYRNYCGLRGMQFDVEKHKKLFTVSYTYILGSMRQGGYGKYALK